MFHSYFRYIKKVRRRIRLRRFWNKYESYFLNSLYVIIPLLFLWLGLHIVNFIKYNTNEIMNNSLNLDKVTYGATYNIKKVETTGNKLNVLNTIYIRNDFEGFRKTQDNQKFQKYVKASNDNLEIAFWAGTDKQYIELFNNGTQVSSSTLKYFDKLDIDRIYKRNNIKNDVDLIKWVVENSNKRTNLLTSINHMKDYYFIQGFLKLILPYQDLVNVSIIDGEYEGFVYNRATLKEFHIIKNDKAYIFDFVNSDYFNTQYILELLGTTELK